MSIWECEGCGVTYSEGDADMIIDHVRDCDRVDGAGHATGGTDEE